MARRIRRVPLKVLQNGRSVGLLRQESTGAIVFQYGDEWLGREDSFPISLSLPLRETAYSGAAVSAVFENLLPDNEALLRLIAVRIHAAGTDVYSLLSRVGRDCVGALQFLPEGEEPGPEGEVRGTPLTHRQVGAMLRNLAAAPLGMGEEEPAFRISLAGAQEKTALLHHNGHWIRPEGSTATSHILKPQIGRIPGGLDLSTSVENEFLCLRLTAALGLRTAVAEITDFDGQRALVVERFDRRWEERRLLRLAQEDCCQALGVPPAQKYESDGGPGMHAILQLLQGSDTPLADQRTFLKAQIVFWLLAATDGHAKNFSLFLYDGGGYQLSPLYDVLSTQPQLRTRQIPRNRNRLAMTAGDNRRNLIHQLQPRHFVQTARRAGVGLEIVRSIVEELADSASAAVDGVLASLPQGFPMPLAEAIHAGIVSRLECLRL